MIQGWVLATSLIGAMVFAALGAVSVLLGLEKLALILGSIAAVSCVVVVVMLVAGLTMEFGMVAW